MNHSIPDFFKKRETKGDIYGYAKIGIGEHVAVDFKKLGVTTAKVRANAASHAAYHGKKFITRTSDGMLYIFREK